MIYQVIGTQSKLGLYVSYYLLRSDEIAVQNLGFGNMYETKINIYASRLAFLPQKVSVRDLSTRWGACTPGGNVYFNWKCVMAPLSVLDYLIVHELVHLEHFNHSREFWDKVSTILPNCEESKDWLKRNGIRLTI